MPAGYRFIIHSGETIEILGAISLRGDVEARSFGAGVIHDLMSDAATRYVTYTMEIIRGDRVVASIPFDPRGLGMSGVP